MNHLSQGKTFFVFSGKIKIASKRTAVMLLVSLTYGCAGPIMQNQNVAGHYATTFPRAEDPISEGGSWVNGGVVGLDWANISITPGRAIGLETGASFTDATAVLQNMSWQPDQKASAVVFTMGAPQGECFQEVELRLRSTISAHSNTGYEINYKVSTDRSAYMQIVRWNGAVGDFTVLQSFSGANFGVASGDTVTATIVGNVITAYRNGVQQGQATDGTYSSGSPGIGFNLENSVAGCAGSNPNYGFTTFTAVDSKQGSF